MSAELGHCIQPKLLLEMPRERLACRHVKLGLAPDAVSSPIPQAWVPTLLDAERPA